MGSRLDSGSNTVRKRIENHVFDNEEGEEYEASNFGGFGDYFRRKKLKLQNLDAEIRSSSPNNPPIFKGVVVHVNGYTQPSLGDLHRLIVSHGGGFLQYLDGKTTATHIIASFLTPKKTEEFKKYRVVKPAWVVESINAGRLLPWDSFRVIGPGSSQRVLKFSDDGQITSTTHHRPSGYREQTESSWYTSQLNQDATSSGLLKPTTTSTPTAEDITSHHHTMEPIDNSVEEDSQDKPETPRNLSNADSALQEDGMSAARTEPVERNKILQDTKTTPEKYNAQLLSNPRMRNASVVNPDFIKQYYQESRLHHLSTWKAELKAQLQAATTAKSTTPGTVLRKRTPGRRRYILHVDFDSFFAAVSLIKHPELASKPVAIAHGTGGSSEIASCNYPARAFGIKNGMWMQGALEKCPELNVLPYDFAAYEDASRKFYAAILSIEGIVQSVSIDEALIDITDLCLKSASSDGGASSEVLNLKAQATADEIAQSLRDSVKEKTGCDVSVGIGGNILQAKLALRKAKPAGQYQLKPDAVLDFVGEFTVQQLPGVAYSLGAKLEELGVKYVKDIRELSKEKLVSSLGPKTGARLWDYARGIENAEVGDTAPRKSVSAEINWGIRFITQEQADEFIQSLCDELHRRLVENGVRGRQLTMRIMRRALDAPLEPEKHLGHGKCDTFNKSTLLGITTNSSEIIGREAISMLRSFKFSPGDLRGVGVQMTKLEPIKYDTFGGIESSQRQLNFSISSPRKRAATPDLDEIITPRKGESSISVIPPPLNDDSQKPLNVTGTQFILPSQANPQVLAELPGDIRSRFASISKRQRINISESPSKSASRPQTPIGLPPQSQLDPETLDALPDDVRAEVLAHYQQSPPTPSRASPATNRFRTHVRTTPTKSRPTRGRGRPIATKSNPNSTLTQSNFISSRPSSSTAATVTDNTATASVEEYVGDIPEEFLSALPEEIRREVIEEHKRSRLQKRAGLDLPAARRPNSNKAADRPADQKLLHFPARAPKPTFTSRKLSSLPELRDALSQWYDSFEDEGPDEEDVNTLIKYLKRVILDERDISKAVAVVEWLGWLLNNHPTKETEGTICHIRPQALETWTTALQKISSNINDAIIQRGLPPVNFT